MLSSIRTNFGPHSLHAGAVAGRTSRIETALEDGEMRGEVRRRDTVPDVRHRPDGPAPTSEDGDAAT